MREVAFLLLKGGVGKTTSAVNFAYVLATKYKKKVLLVDIDQQGNATQQFQIDSSETYTISDLLVKDNMDIKDVIVPTQFKNLSVIPADSSLVKVNQKIPLLQGIDQQMRFKRYIDTLRDSDFDYIVYDCPTATTVTTMNALICTDDVIFPVRIDRYTFEAITESLKLIRDVKRYNPKINFSGCLVTAYSSSNLTNSAIQTLRESAALNVFDTKIRSTVRVAEATYTTPVCHSAPKCTAAIDYTNFVAEYLKRVKKGNK